MSLHIRIYKIMTYCDAAQRKRNLHSAHVDSVSMVTGTDEGIKDPITANALPVVFFWYSCLEV